MNINIHDVYRPMLRYFRKNRVKTFYETLGIGPETSILDVGGTSFFWRMASDLDLPTPREITILNIHDQNEELPDGVRWVRADARDMPFEDGQFDVAFSNSVIEHLETAANQAAMAAEIRRVAKMYWVQTPDPRFPIEPHYITPFIHWFPIDVRRQVLRNGTVWGIVTRPTQVEVDAMVKEIRLLPPDEFRALFQDAKIVTERFAGLPKSMVAVRCG
jgi:hypothetical protein